MLTCLGTNGPASPAPKAEKHAKHLTPQFLLVGYIFRYHLLYLGPSRRLEYLQQTRKSAERALLEISITLLNSYNLILVQCCRNMTPR